MKYSVIIPYQHSEERQSLLYSCIQTLIEVSGGNLEICVHETGEIPTLKLPSRCKYLFTEYSDTFHRAWSLNRGARELATGEILVLMDGDLIVNQQWYKELVQCTKPSVGWGKIEWINKEGTIEKTKTPSKGSAAGGITVIPTTIFNEVKGVPEDFYGSWGGEDNAFWSKLTSLGYPFKSFNSTITHLYHSRSTPRILSIQKKALPMFYWNREQWEKHIEASSDAWGSSTPSTIEIDKEFISDDSKAKLTIAMLSWIRPEKLIETLTSLDETLTFPINLVLMVQGSETLSKDQKSVIKNLASRFYRKDVFFTKGNIGTGPARAHLLQRALTRFYAPYFNFGDDDTTYTKGSVEAAVELMERDRSIGVVGIRYKHKLYKLGRTIYPRYITKHEPRSSIEYVDSTGSASAIIRREVFELCKVDPSYELGQWDLDLFFQARHVGWKIVNYQAFSGMRANNNWGGSEEYRKARMNRKKINKSIKIFKSKWGLERAI